MSILVTGSTGFVGRAVVDAFARGGDQVRAAARRQPEKPFAPGVEVVLHGDLAAPIDWSPLVAGIDSVVHLAGIAHVGNGIPADRYDQVNRAATADLAQAAARAGVRQLVFVSSIRAQTGPSADHALTENDIARPTDAYGQSKLAAEKAVRDSGVPCTIMRPVVFYGPAAKGNVGLILRAAASPLPLPVKSFVNRRSMIGIDNFVSALRFVLASDAAIGQTYVVADPGIPPRFCDLFAILRRARHRRPLLVPLSPEYLEWPLRLIGRNDFWERLGGNLRVDASKLIEAGWHPLHDTAAGFAALASART
jgi:UDP-glucose 4-epimerase